MIQIFDIYGGIEDRNILKREYQINRINKIKYHIIKRKNSLKLKELAKIQNLYRIRSMIEEIYNPDVK